MNDFFDTAVGKIVKTTLWLAGSYLVAFAVSFIGSHHFTGVYVVLPGLINIVAYGFTTIQNKEVPNLPSSVPMTLVAAVTPEDPPVEVAPAPVDPVVSPDVTHETPLDPPTPATPVEIPVTQG